MIKGWIEVFMRGLLARYCDANAVALQNRVDALEAEMRAIRAKAEEYWGTTGSDMTLKDIAERIRSLVD